MPDTKEFQKKHIVMYSAGLGSWAAAQIVAQKYGIRNTYLLFTDTLYEDADSYRFLVETAACLYGIKLPFAVPRAEQFPDYRVDLDTPIEAYAGNPTWRNALRVLREAVLKSIPNLIWLVEGRDPWEVFRDRRMLGNSRRDPCSLILKRELSDKWRKENADPSVVVCHVGIDWTEAHRFDDGKGGGLGPRQAERGWTYKAPLTEPPHYWKQQIKAALAQLGIDEPRMYKLGYAHNNCGGFCIKAGHAHYANRLQVNRDRYLYDEAMERKMQEFLNHPYSMLTDRRGDNKKKTFSLAQLRAELESGEVKRADLDDYGGCGCFVDE